MPKVSLGLSDKLGGEGGIRGRGDLPWIGISSKGIDFLIWWSSHDNSPWTLGHLSRREFIRFYQVFMQMMCATLLNQINSAKIGVGQIDIVHAVYPSLW